MTLREVEAVLHRHDEDYQDGWEKVRWLGFINAATQGAKVKEPKDLLPFSWDKKSDKIKEVKHAPSEIEKMRASMIDSYKKYESGQTVEVKV